MGGMGILFVEHGQHVQHVHGSLASLLRFLQRKSDHLLELLQTDRAPVRILKRRQRFLLGVDGKAFKGAKKDLLLPLFMGEIRDRGLTVKPPGVRGTGQKNLRLLGLETNQLFLGNQSPLPGLMQKFPGPRPVFRIFLHPQGGQLPCQPEPLLPGHFPDRLQNFRKTHILNLSLG